MLKPSATRLYTDLLDEEARSRPQMSLCVVDEQSYQRETLTARPCKRFFAVLQDHILKGTTSVVLCLEETASGVAFTMCCPLSLEECRKLRQSHYVPPMKEALPVSVGLDQNRRCAFATCRLAAPCNPVALFGVMRSLKNTLEALVQDKEMDSDVQ